MRYLLLLLILTGCIPKNENTPEVQKRFVFLPKADTDSKPYSLAEKPCLYNDAIYIGAFPDTVDLNKAYRFDTIWGKPFGQQDKSFEKKNASFMATKRYLKNIEDHIAHSHNERNFNQQKNDSLSVFLDTTQLSSSGRAIRVIDVNPGKIQYYPVSIKNTGRDTFFFYCLEIFVEAQIENLNWKQISSSNFDCSTGAPLYWFAPGETLVSYIPKYSGITKSIFRVACIFNKRTYYSQLYHGSLHPKLLK